MATKPPPKPAPRQEVRAAPRPLTVEQSPAKKRDTVPDHGERQDFGGARREVPARPRCDAAKAVPAASSGGAAASPQGRPRPGSAPHTTNPESNLKARQVRVDKGERQDFGNPQIERKAQEGFVRKNPGDTWGGQGLRAEPVPIEQRSGETFRGPVPTDRPGNRADGEATDETNGRMREYITRGPAREEPPKPKRGRNNRWYDHRTSGYVNSNSDSRGYPDQPTPPRNAGLSRFGAGHTRPGPVGTARVGVVPGARGGGEGGRGGGR